MNAQELRIGNLIQIELGEIEIAKVEELTLETEENNNQYYFLTFVKRMTHFTVIFGTFSIKPPLI